MTPWILDAVRQLKCLGLKGFEDVCSRDRQNRRPVPGVTAQAARSRHDSLQGTLHFNGDYREHHRYRASGELARSRNCRQPQPSRAFSLPNSSPAMQLQGHQWQLAGVSHSAWPAPLPGPSPVRSLRARSRYVRRFVRASGALRFPPPYSSSVLGGEDARGLLREAVASPIFSVGANAGSLFQRCRRPIRDVSRVLLLQTRTARPGKQHCSQAGSTQMSGVGHLSHSIGVFVLLSLIARHHQGADG